MVERDGEYLEDDMEAVEDDYDEYDDDEYDDDEYDGNEYKDEPEEIYENDYGEENIDILGNLVRVNSSVKIVGSGKITSKHFGMGPRMQSIIREGNIQKVTSIARNCATICGYSWHVKDLLVLKAEEVSEQTSKPSIFDPNDLDLS